MPNKHRVTNKDDSNTNLEDLKKLVVKFRRERDWEKHFTPKNVATSIAIEAAELLEHFQWDLLMKNDEKEISRELADVLIFAFHFATLYDLDIATIFNEKLSDAEVKYPVGKFKKGADHNNEYHKAKQKYRKAKR